MTRTASRPLNLLFIAALLLGLLVVVPPPAAEASSSAEQDFVQRLNRERTNRGLPALQVATDLRSVARSHSNVMARQQDLHHNPNLGTDVKNWRRVTENVGYGPSVSGLHSALMNSSGHRANILDPNVSQVGVGVTVSGGTVWVTQVFRSPTGSAVLSGGGVNPFPGGFSDVDRSSTHGADIERLRKTGVTSGCGSNRYCPDRNVTRAEMASFLTRAMNLPRPSGNRFRDVSGTHTADINALAAAGITLGCNPPRNDRFCPDRAVTRAEMASFLVRARSNISPSDSNQFRDVPSSNSHRRDINGLGRSGVTRGCNPPSNTNYCPSRAVTRAQMASFMVRAFNL